MAEPDVYLEKLSAFSRMLHLENLSVSPKETEDAARLLIALGVDDRERVKTALRTVYANPGRSRSPLTGCSTAFFSRRNRSAVRPRSRWSGSRSWSSTAGKRRRSFS